MGVHQERTCQLPNLDVQGPYTGTVTAVLSDWRDPNERVFLGWWIGGE